MAASPYCDKPFIICFSCGTKLWVPGVFIYELPKLLEQKESYVYEIYLKRFSRYAGHVLVHYLFTGTYQCLGGTEASPEEKSRHEFATSVEVYVLAGEYELPALKELAKGEMERVGSNLQATQLLDILKEKYPNPRADDIWLHNYIKSQIIPVLENPAKSETNENSLSLTNFLLRAMVDLFPEAKDSSPSTPLSKTVSQAESTKRQAESEIDDEGRNGKKRKGENKKGKNEKEEAEEAGLPMRLKTEPVSAEQE
ncbi:hypothetical protein F4818DRAFT_427477 [Hypoxylon cercidicola]|nr:hypothetical protein F4818DRAFT_427477 [Hypoxylon cercidicola]